MGATQGKEEAVIEAAARELLAKELPSLLYDQRVRISDACSIIAEQHALPAYEAANLASMAAEEYEDVPDFINTHPETYFETVLGPAGPHPGKFKAGALATTIVAHQPLVYFAGNGEMRWFDGRVWRPDGAARVRELARLILNHPVERTIGENTDWERVVHMGGFVDRMATFNLREVIHHVGVRTQVWPRDWERFDENLIPVRNGVLDINTRTLVPYRHEKHRFYHYLPVPYEPGATCRSFEEFVGDVCRPASIAGMQEMFGYCIWPEGVRTMKKAIMLYGSGDNGKSILLAVLTALLGQENTCSITLTGLSENRFATSSLRGKLANIFPDLPDRALRDTGIFKGLVGDDLIPYEVKYGGRGEFRNRAKLVFSANKMPAANDDTDAFYSRLLLIDFPYVFVDRPNPENPMERKRKDKAALLASLMTELPGILNWSLDGLARLRSRGAFANDMRTDAMRDLYVRLSNTRAAFIQDQCTFESEATIVKTDFYLAYVQYCERNGLSPDSMELVGRRLPSDYPGRITSTRPGRHGDRRYVWKGIRLKTEEERRNEGLIQEVLE